MKLTVGLFQELYAIAKSDMDQVDKDIQTVATLTGKTEREIDEMPVTEFKRLARTASEFLSTVKLPTKPLSFLRANGRIYQINYKVSSITQGQYTDVQAWLKGDIIENMDKILASVSVPVKKRLWYYLPEKYDSTRHDEYCKDFKDMLVSDVYPCVVFFWKIFSGSIKGIVNSLDLTENDRKMMSRLVTDLQILTDGFTTQKGWQTSAI